MGKLAERLADARRSGVYRVEATDVLEEAAALNGFALARIGLDDVSGSALDNVCTRALAACADGHVLLFSGFESLVRGAPGALEPLLSALDAAAGGRRADGLRFFAAFLDPSGILPLAPLYNRRQHSPSSRS